MPLNKSVMLESVANIKTLMIEENLLSQSHRRVKLVSTIKKYYGRQDSLVAVSELVSDLMASNEAR